MKQGLLSILLVIALGVGAEIPAGYYESAVGKSSAELKEAMHKVIAPHTRIDYGAKGTWSVFRTSDVRPDGTIWDMYSDEVRYFPASGSHPDMHIEHSVPKSWWGEQSTFVYEASFDIHHLVPSDASANMSKSNNILGEVVTATFDNGVSKIGKATVDGKELSVFEPADEYKGDFARMYMYVVTCYQDYTWMSNGVYMFNTEAYPTLNSYAQELLMRWHRQDPVSEKEVNRNEAVYSAQSNRNPFIDFPLLAEYLWGDSIGCTFTAQTGEYPYWVTPRKGEKIDMGAVLSGATVTYDLSVEGRFLNKPVQLSWKQNRGIELSATTLQPEEVIAGTVVQLSYTNNDLLNILRDTLVISGGGVSSQLELPVELRATTSFIPLTPINITATGATLRWVEMSQADGYVVELYEGASEATDLFISAYVEGSSYNKAIALYNGTGRAINLSDYAFGRQHNGAGEIVDYWTLPNKTLAAGATYIFVNSQCSDEALRGYADTFVPSHEYSPINFNGNDAVALYHNNMLIDIVGVLNDINNWGKDVTMYRTHETLGPTTQFDASNWEVADKDDFTQLRSHKMTGITANPQLVARIETDEISAEVSSLTPETVYSYTVKALLPASEQEGLYACIFATDKLSAPIGLKTDKVHASGFEIHWEEVVDAKGYEVDCFTLEGSASTTAVEEFDGVGSNGKPLPEGWTGSASGNYTSAASSGSSVPSIALKNTGEYIQTPTYNSPITALSFMYRFASKATGSSLSVEMLQDDKWMPLQTIEYVNTTKTTIQHTFELDDNVRAFRFTYSKESGNLAIDDVAITYGSLDTVFVVKEAYIEQPMYEVFSLSSPVTYFYRVRSVLDNIRSEWSSVGCVTTDPNITGVGKNSISSVFYTTDGQGIILQNLPINSNIELYDMRGVLCHRAIATSTMLHIPVYHKGIYLIKVVDEVKTDVIKTVF